MFTLNNTKHNQRNNTLNKISKTLIVGALALFTQGCQTMETQQNRDAWQGVFQTISQDIQTRQDTINRNNAIQNDMILRQRAPMQQTYQRQPACAWNDYWCQTNTQNPNQ